MGKGDLVAVVGRARTSSASLAAWGLLAVTLAAMTLGQILEYAADGTDGSLAEDIGLSVAFMAFPVVGTLIASRHPRNAIGWLLLGIGLLVAVLVVGTAYAQYGLVLHPERDLPGTTLAAWIENWAWLPLIMTIPTLLFLLFPTGRPPSRRWIPVAWFAAIYVSIVTLLSMLEETLSGYGLDNPIGIRGLGDVEEMGIVFVPLIPLILLCASSLVFRYRQAHSEERQQLKWVAVAAVVFAVGVIMGEMAERFELPEIAFPIFLGALPASIGVAMMKYRLYDIDVIINRTLVYGVLTAILGFVYVGLVLILQQVTASVTRVSDLAIAVSTLTVAGLFRPARSRVQALIDRHFYRRKYDAVKTVDEFSQRLRSEVELESLTRELLDVINRTMQPRYASVWLRTSSGTEAQHHGAGKSRA